MLYRGRMVPSGFSCWYSGRNLAIGFRFSFTVGNLFGAVVVAQWAHTLLGPSLKKLSALLFSFFNDCTSFRLFVVKFWWRFRLMSISKTLLVLNR